MVNNDVGCFDSTHTNLVVRQVTTYFFPTAFTPDGNGVNEEFKIVGDGVQEKDYHLAIFDRWGGKVFETTSLHAGWNGKMMNTGDELPVGQYSYTVTLRHHDGRKVTETGEVTLIR